MINVVFVLFLFIASILMILTNCKINMFFSF